MFVSHISIKHDVMCTFSNANPLSFLCTAFLFPVFFFVRYTECYISLVFPASVNFGAGHIYIVYGYLLVKIKYLHVRHGVYAHIYIYIYLFWKDKHENIYCHSLAWWENRGPIYLYFKRKIYCKKYCREQRLCKNRDWESFSFFFLLILIKKLSLTTSLV